MDTGDPYGGAESQGTDKLFQPGQSLADGLGIVQRTGIDYLIG